MPRAHGPARVGKRVPLQTVVQQREDAKRIVGYVCGIRPLPFGEVTLLPGVEVPGAKDWTRLEAWVNCRRVVPIYDGDPFTSYDDYVNSLEDQDVTGAAVPEDVTGAAAEDQPEE